jgi:hypothetical protein
VRGFLAASAVVAAVTVPFAGVLLPGGSADGPTAFVATAEAAGDIPLPMLALYQQAVAARCPGLPWPVLAAVGKVETDHARNVAVSSAGARGPMQFMPGTWRAYGLDADGDGIADIDNPVDAVHSAAHYLCASGGGNPATLRNALWAYNHATWYVDLVLERAGRYAVAAAAPPASSDAQALAANPRVLLTPRARGDLLAGAVDPRVVALLSAISQRHTIAVSVFSSGHTKFVAGTRSISNHWCGQAADVWQVDGVRVARGNPAARAVAEWLAALPAEVRPHEVGTPWPDLRSSGFFSDRAHQGHLHLGYGPRCRDR